MEISAQDFEDKFQDTLDTLLVTLAEHPEVEPEKFYSMACLLENLAFFGPVIYGTIQNAKNK